MRAKLTLLRALVLGTIGGVLATGCQTYDFEPVQPLAISQTTETRRIEARARKPNLMLLVDTSGSMTDPADKSDPDCRPGGVLCGDSRPCNTAVCPTRWSELQKAMQTFLNESGKIARMGLATYPSDDSCGSSTTVSIPLPDGEMDDEATLAANAELVKNEILSIKNYSTTDPMPQGGTPTSKSLLFVGNRPELQTDREDLVVLLTDGLPNCNEGYPSGAECFCTLSDCTYAQAIGCLDKDASVDAVKALRAKEIRTIVIGFGADFNTSSASGSKGAETLSGMAVEGGFSLDRSCTTNAQCGSGDECDTATKFCKRRFYQASSSAELTAALKDISEKVLVQDPCVLNFESSAQVPAKSELVVVYVNGERQSAGADTWELTTTGIKFVGSTCTRIENSTSANPVEYEVRAVVTP
ncbi:adventurous gliding motility lipoprotein CglB [Archangium lansingense]|uniref:Adventurous gliding motility lipoprotein CglB n=1 Tax=Archangium lansingense TaxID=2995310 RepID=A0ABT4A6A6_9BACT|nr:adventurous gliding motility lipoprotein CglB [Archangium lansinium]MCY1077157.1 adventurous gliding motility lipoprotein CglB [Archangium lansinium]